MKKQFLLLFVMMLLPMVASADVSGICGDNLTWIFVESTGTLKIEGNGAMKNYSEYTTPWHSFVDSIKKISIDKEVTTIGNYAFHRCSNITSIVIPDNVTSIGASAFAGCSSLASVIIPNNVTSIGHEAFQYSGITSVTIGSSVKSIGTYAFNCSDITKTIWLTNTPPSGYSYLNGKYNYVSNDQYKDLKTKKIYPFLSSMFEVNGIKYVPVSPSEHTCDAIDCVYDSSATNTIISPTVIYKGVAMSVQNVQPYICYNNPFIENLTYNKDGSISECAFYGCANLKHINWGDKISAINKNAFSACYSLQSLEIPNSVEELGDYSFSYCSSLNKVSIGNHVKSLGGSLFTGCTSLTDINFGEQVEGISGFCFQGCTSLANVTIGNQIKTIGYQSFQNCTALTNVIIGDQVESIGEGAFIWCRSLTNVKIGNHVNIINEKAFEDCAKLAKISIPKSVSIIKNSVFKGCSSLKEFVVEDRDTELELGRNKITNSSYASLFSDCILDSIYIGGTITYTTSPFIQNKTLRAVVFSNSKTDVLAKMFYGCVNLQNLTIGDGVTSFGDWAFSGCTGLKFLSFGTQLKTIGKEAFSDCSAITTIVSKTQTPPTCGSQALDDINKWTCMLTVPKGCKDNYAAADQWKDFFYIVEDDGSGHQNPDTPETKKCEKPTISYSNGKLTFSCGTEGATCMSTIKDTDITSYATNEVQLSVTYTVSVYATLAGYEDSDIATATLCWIDQQPATEGMTDGIGNVPAQAVLIQSAGGSIKVQGVDEGTQVNVYGINGTQAGSAISQSGSATINTNLQPGSIAIVKIGQKSVKVVMK